MPTLRVAANKSKRASLEQIEFCQKIRHQRPEICEPIGFRLKHNDEKREQSKVLLKCKISIDCNKHIEMLGCKLQQFSVCDRCPTHLARSLNLVPDDVACEAPINAFVKEHFHEVVSISRSFASSRKTITCCRVTDGKPARKSSIDSPASR